MIVCHVDGDKKVSRSRAGGKPVGWEYWGKRKGGWCVDRKTSHKMERMQQKEEDRKTIQYAHMDADENVNILRYPYIKSLFPEATIVTWYHDFMMNKDMLLIDGEKSGSLDDVHTVLAYAYHCGVSYTNYEDLREKYHQYLLDGNNPWDFLP